MEREKFARRLNDIFSCAEYFSMEEAVSALLLQDAEALDKMRNIVVSLKSQSKKYLDSYDAAKTDKEKERVIAEVTKR